MSRIPRGALWAVAFFVAAELGARAVGGSFALQIEQHNYLERDTLDYDAVSLAIDVLPPPDIVVMGTSRAREAIQSPTLRAALKQRLGKSLTVRNYGVASGRIDTSLNLFERLAAQGKLPKLIILSVDGSDFRDAKPSPDRLRIASLSSLTSDIRRNGWPSEAELSYAVGNSVPLRLVTIRRAVHYRLVERRATTLAEAKLGNSAFGGTSDWARAYVASLANRRSPPPMKSRKKRVRQTRRGYVIQDHQLAKLNTLVDLARSHSVRVVLAELPVAPKVRISENVIAARNKTRGALEAQAVKGCVWAVSIDAYDNEFGILEFREDSHLSFRGSRHFVDLIAPAVADGVRSLDAGERCR